MKGGLTIVEGGVSPRSWATTIVKKEAKSHRDGFALNMESDLKCKSGMVMLCENEKNKKNMTRCGSNFIYGDKGRHFSPKGLVNDKE
jgi:hypothetical protein